MGNQLQCCIKTQDNDPFDTLPDRKGSKSKKVNQLNSGSGTNHYTSGDNTDNSGSQLETAGTIKKSGISSPE